MGAGRRVRERYPEVVSLVRVVVVKRRSFRHTPPGTRRTPSARGPLTEPSRSCRPATARSTACSTSAPSRRFASSASPAASTSAPSATGRGSWPLETRAWARTEPFQLKEFKLVGVETPTTEAASCRRRLQRGAPRSSVDRRRALAEGPHRPGARGAPRHGGDPPAQAGRFDGCIQRRQGASRRQSLTIDLDNGWSVTTTAAEADKGLFRNTNALALLLAGIALSLLLGLLVVVLATGRTRALRLVNEQTLELREQAAELREMVAELETAQAVKDEFLTLISHELRTPDVDPRLRRVAPGRGAGGHPARLPERDRQERRAADQPRRGPPRDGSDPERRDSLQLSEVILGDLIASSGEAAEHLAESKDIGLELDTQPGVTAQGDPVRLGQVLDNLISNAIKSPNGGSVGHHDGPYR